MGILIYQPTPVLIPEDSACRRDFLSRRSTVDNNPLTETDYREYDSRTLFYDVFRCDDDGNVVAIGPPPVNLRNELQKLRITCDGRLIPHCKREYRNLCILELTCDQTTHAGKNLPLRFSFPSFDVDIEVPPPAVPSTAEGSHLGLMTLQKNNPLPWILDWCRWHHRLHGVSRLVLYDNASDNRDDLVATRLGWRRRSTLYSSTGPSPMDQDGVTRISSASSGHKTTTCFVLGRPTHGA